MISSNSLFDTTNVRFSEPKRFVCISASIEQNANANFNGTLIANSVSKFLTNVEPIHINDPRRLSKNAHDCIIFAICF